VKPLAGCLAVLTPQQRLCCGVVANAQQPGEPMERMGLRLPSNGSLGTDLRRPSGQLWLCKQDPSVRALFSRQKQA
jgi:hypothetical protein